MRKNEKGRSMVEMLGVLAIIGVLSVGGIYGYTVAMNKYRANEIVQTASMLATLAGAANAGDGITADLTAQAAGLVEADGEVGGVVVSGMTAVAGATPYNVTLTAPADICAAVRAIAPTASDSDAAIRANYYITCTDA